MAANVHRGRRVSARFIYATLKAKFDVISRLFIQPIIT